MKLTTNALLLTVAVALSACANADRFGSGTGGNGSGNAPLDGLGSGGIDSQPLPDSPQYFSQVVGDRVLFAVDQSTLSPEARATLDAQANWLTVNDDYLALIEGHADEQGTREYNLALGARRANAVMEYLISRGISSSRLKFVSYGKERPIEVCSEEACYAKNRRAVTVISIGAGV